MLFHTHTQKERNIVSKESDVGPRFDFPPPLCPSVMKVHDCSLEGLFSPFNSFNSLPHGKTLDWSKLRASGYVKINVPEKPKLVLGTVRKRDKRRKCWLPAL